MLRGGSRNELKKEPDKLSDSFILTAYKMNCLLSYRETILAAVTEDA